MLTETFYFHGYTFGKGGFAKTYIREWTRLTIYMTGDLREVFGRPTFNY